VLSFLRLCRNWLGHSTQYTFTKNFMSKQAFNHFLLSCQSGVLKVKLCRELQAPVHLEESGSDACERFFSGLGGCGKTMTSRRNYDFDGVLEMTGDANTLEVFRVDPSVELEFRRHHKMEWFLAKDEDHELPDASRTAYPSDAEIIAA
jgi:hypothetical protein|tara:strand:+ start:55 stop:498 length:444 start_codon:yes stop_codon:yes gene_type:complete